MFFYHHGIKKLGRGFYSNVFFHIFINGSFDSDLEKIQSLTDAGTAVHEYIHYIQNIGTLWGLYESIARYEHLLEFKEAITKADNISRPFSFPLSDNF